MATTNTTLDQLINTEIEQKYRISFFEPFLVNYLADIKPAMVAKMSDQEYDLYIQEKNEAAMQEFCAQIKLGKSIENATRMAIQILLADFAE